MIMMSLLDRQAIDRAMAALACDNSHPPVFMLVKRDRGARSEPTKKTRTLWSTPAGMKSRSAKTTNGERKLADLETAVVNGIMTADEADRIYGRKERGVAAGRQRRYPSFEAWLRARIAKLSDPAELASRMARIRQDRSLSRAQKGALVRELNRQAWQRDPEYVEGLRVALAELSPSV